MSDLNWKQVEQVIDEILDLPQEKHYAAIQKKCGHNQQLKAEVTQLIESIYDSDGWLTDLQSQKSEMYDISEDLESLSPDQDIIDQEVGAYTIKKKIGEGGMGLVYLAKRTDQSFDHQVAIKIIRRNQATETNIERFKREQQILAGLNHPGIARLYDGGITSDGFPYIIMEYVDGIPITKYCHQNSSSIKERVYLFKQVLEAVRYAHENLVIHRDLKPDNILVNDSDEIKILDFGISKLLESDDDLNLTQTGSRILTPKYAAPEQIKQTNITTAADLYSLGTVFFELLCGNPPFNLDNCTAYQAEQIILKNAPPKPSNKTSDKKLGQKLRGDLNAISLKAIRKEPEQRYRVATEFLDDLNNYQKKLPISARTDSFQYRTSKFIGRHKQSLTAAALILILIVGLSGFYTLRIAEERNFAQQEAQKAANISDFLLALFEASDPSTTGGEEITARQLLQEGRDKAGQIVDEPMRANMLSVIGEAYSKLGYRDSALTILSSSKELIEQAKGTQNLEYADINFTIGKVYDVYTDLALPYFRRSNAIRSELLGPNHPKTAETLLEIGKAKNNLGEIDSAKYYIEQAKQIVQKNTSLNPSATIEIDEEIARIHSRSGDYEKASEIYKNLLSRSQSVLKTDSLTISRWNQNIAWTYIPRQQFQKAVPHLETALAITESLLGKGHETTLRVRNDLAGVNSDLGNLKRFQNLSEANIKYTLDRYGNSHKMSCQANSAYGLQLTLHKIFDKGEQYLHNSLDICSRTLGDDHLWTAFNKGALSANLELNNKQEASNKYFNESYQVFEENKENFNRVNERQISLILKIYKEVDSQNTNKIEKYKSLLSDDS